jgi:hypothetical protein
MNKITVEQVKGIEKKDRIKVTYLNKDGKEVSKNTRFYGIEHNQYTKKNIILVYEPRKQKSAWKIEEFSECIIEKI